jgi:hypothetical protein
MAAPNVNPSGKKCPRLEKAEAPHPMIDPSNSRTNYLPAILYDS